MDKKITAETDRLELIINAIESSLSVSEKEQIRNNIASTRFLIDKISSSKKESSADEIEHIVELQKFFLNFLSDADKKEFLC